MRAPERAGGWQKERPFLPGSQAACGPVEPRSGPGPAGARRRRRVRPVMPARVVRRRVAGPYVHRAMARRARRSSTRRVRANAGAPGRARRAWPASVSRCFPGPGLSDAWFVFVALFAVLSAGAVFYLLRPNDTGATVLAASRQRRRVPQLQGRAIARPRPLGSQASATGRGWAEPKDVRPLRVRKAPGDRIVLGTHAGRTAGGRGSPLGHGRRADPVRQDDRACHPCDPGVVGARARDERQGRPAQRDARMATDLSARSSYYDPTGAVGLDRARAGPGPSGWSPLASAGDLVRGKAHGLGALLGGQGR